MPQFPPYPPGHPARDPRLGQVPGARGRGPGGHGPLGVGYFGEESDLDRISRGKKVRIADAALALAEDSVVPQLGQPIGIMAVTHIDPKINLVTVQLDRVKEADAPNCELRVRVRWGVGGASDQLEADWADGGLISVVADEIWVDAVPYVPLEGPFNPTGFNRLVSACVGVGSTDAIPPQFTSQTRVRGGGTTTDFVVPPYARAVSLIAFDEAGDFVDPYPDIVMQLVRTSVISQMATFVGPTIAGGAAVPLSAAERVRILIHPAHVGLVRLTVVFHLGT